MESGVCPANRGDLKIYVVIPKFASSPCQKKKRIENAVNVIAAQWSI